MTPNRATPLTVPPDCRTLHLPPGEYFIANSPLRVGETQIVGSGWRNTVCRAADGTDECNSGDLTRLEMPQDGEAADAA
jgi:hypothetical protein